MTAVYFATCDHQPLTAADDEPLADALTALGYDVTPIPWTEIDPHAVVDAWPIVLRSTWDYHRVPTMFAAWLDGLAESGRTVLNPPTVVRRNIDKIYLRDLEAGGIPLPRIRWIDRPDSASLQQILREEQWSAAVLKPRIAATAHGMFLLASGVDLDDGDLAPARLSGAMVQEFIPEICERGELSLVYAGRDFSHAVSKRPQAGDFRVQKDFGGTVVEAAPSADALALAARVMSAVPPECAYARIDVVESDRGPLLMELELIEPEFYFSIKPGSAARMAAEIAARLQ